MNLLTVTLPLDQDVLEKLRAISYPVQLCEPSGRILGRFIPAFDPSQYVALNPEISAEELQRRKESNEKRYTTAEVLAYLEKL